MHITPAGVAHACGARGARGALRLVGGHHNNVGVSLRERRATTQVMLGVSLRARWDATLVYIKGLIRNHCLYFLTIKLLFVHCNGGLFQVSSQGGKVVLRRQLDSVNL